MVLLVLDDKNLENNWRENDKKLIVILDRLKREREYLFENFWKSEEHVKSSCFKKLSDRSSIGWKIGSIDQNTYLIDPASIE